MNKKEYEGISAFHPGYYVYDIIENMEITQDEFAKRLGVTPKNLSDLINGKASISDNFAVNLSLMLGTSVEMWLNLQKTYDEKVIEVDKLQHQRQEEVNLTLIDYDYFSSLNLVKATKDKAEKVAELLKYFNVSTLNVFKKTDMLVQFRQGSSAVTDEKCMLNSNAWVQTVINCGKGMKTQPYDEKRLKEYLPRIREMTFQDPADFREQLCGLLAECGVALVILPSLKNSRVYGATKWINNEKVVLGITNRGIYADTFWFSLFHELGHVLQKRIKTTFISFDNNDSEEDFESKADSFARDILIPPREFDQFKNSQAISEIAVRQFAERIQIHPGVVVGRLQNEKLVPYSHFNKLRVQYKFFK